MLMVANQPHHLSPRLYGDAMMRLHEVQVRVAPVLRWAVTGAPSAAVAQVISSSVGIATMIIPARGWDTSGTHQRLSATTRSCWEA